MDLNLETYFNNLNLIDSPSIDPWLINDINIIITCWTNELPQLLFNNLLVKKIYNMNETDLYYKIIEIIKERNLIINLLELMPYIDDYLEYYSSL